MMAKKHLFLGFAVLLANPLIYTVAANHVVIDPTSCQDSFLGGTQNQYAFNLHITLGAKEASDWLREAIDSMKRLINLRDRTYGGIGRYTPEDQALLLGLESIASRLFRKDQYDEVLGMI